MIQGFRHGGAYGGPGAGMGRLRQQFQQQALQQQQPQQMQRLQQMQQMQPSGFNPQQLQQVGVSQQLGQQAMSMPESGLSSQRLQMLRQQVEAMRPSEPGDLAMSPDPALVGLSAPSQISGFQPPRPPDPNRYGVQLPGFAKPIPPPPSAGGGGGGQGGAPPTSWKMSIEPMAYGGIIGLADGGYIPLYARGRVPGYGLGGFFKGLGKVVSKVAPIAMNFIPGASSLSGLAKAGIGALTQGAGDLASGKGFNLQSMLGGAGRSYAASSALDRMRNIEGLEGQGLWGSLGKMLTDKDIGQEAMTALADIPSVRLKHWL